MDKNIGNILREKRIESGMSVKDISARLTDKGYKASEKTVYSWENGNSQPTPEALLEMCDAYGIKNILSTFGYNGYKEDGSLQLNMNEQDLVEKYRFISKNLPSGAETVDFIINQEYKEALKSKKTFDELVEKTARIVELETTLNNQRYAVRLYTYMNKIASAGTGFYFDDIPTDTIEAPYCKGADFIIGVNGDSMEPDYHDGEKLYVQKAKDLSIGDVGIFTVWNECFVKELGERGLISRNPAYDDIPGSEDVKLIGRVLGKVEGN